MRTPKPTQSAPKSPKRAQMSPTKRPAPKNHEKSSPKHGPEQRRTMKKQSVPCVFVYFAESPWPMAFGPWPSTFDCRHRALGVQNRATRSELVPGRNPSGVPSRAFGRRVATQSRQRGPQSRHRAPQSRRRRPQGAQQRQMMKKRLRSMFPSSAEP